MDQRTNAKDSTAFTRTDIPAGSYDFAVAVVDKTRNNVPAIKLALTGDKSTTGWNKLSTTMLEAAPTATPSASATATPSASATPSIKLSADSMAQGGKLTITGENFKAESSATFTLHSEPVQLGTATADANGVVSLGVVLPSDIPAGQHRIVIDAVRLDGEAYEVSAPLTITAAAASATATDSTRATGNATAQTTAAGSAAAQNELAKTSANNTRLGGMAVLLLISRAAVFAASRRRSASH
ncbi:hypothetical protein [Arthrobacter sp.]|uniref:hypothetical protein n=1 Tax=Arthrobacter sp. TaxID=1667 RepID=UPI0026DF9158|nr:hypothetical protein [Arthrobacter sp.]MDO5754152.1 hypothetical protein [Arthrobacter sp.]